MRIVFPTNRRKSCDDCAASLHAAAAVRWLLLLIHSFEEVKDGYEDILQVFKAAMSFIIIWSVVQSKVGRRADWKYIFLLTLESF